MRRRGSALGKTLGIGLAFAAGVAISQCDGIETKAQSAYDSVRTEVRQRVGRDAGSEARDLIKALQHEQYPHAYAPELATTAMAVGSALPDTTRARVAATMLEQTPDSLIYETVSARIQGFPLEYRARIARDLIR